MDKFLVNCIWVFGAICLLWCAVRSSMILWKQDRILAVVSALGIIYVAITDLGKIQ